MTAGEGVGRRSPVAEAASQLSGPIVVEDVTLQGDGRDKVWLRLPATPQHTSQLQDTTAAVSVSLMIGFHPCVLVPRFACMLLFFGACSPDCSCPIPVKPTLNRVPRTRVQVLRRMVFTANRNLIQSEAVLVRPPGGIASSGKSATACDTACPSSGTV